MSHDVTLCKVAECIVAVYVCTDCSICGKCICTSVQRMQAWLGEPPILTTVLPVYIKIKN